MRTVIPFGKRRRRSQRRRDRRSGFSSVGVVLLVGGAWVLGYLALGPVTTITVSGTSFTRCARPPHANCVIDGDTFYFGGQPVRIADIDTPETHRPQCAYEASLGAQATRRLLELLNAGSFVLESRGLRDEDRYGRKLRTVLRNGSSLGDVLVSEGLAREWTGRRLPWCD